MKEGEFENFENESEFEFKFDWATGQEFEYWISVEGGKIRIRTEITYFRLSPEGGQENRSDEHNRK